MQAGMVLTSQGAGAALAMPFAGRVTDRLGPRRLIPVGVGLMLVGTLPFTQVDAGASSALLIVGQFVRGVGLGFTILPSAASALKYLSHDEIPSGSTALNTIQRFGSSVGAALMSVVLEQQLRGVIPAAHSDALPTIASMSPSSRAHASGPLAVGFAHTFWLALILTALTAAPVVFMRRRRQSPVGLDITAPGPVAPETRAQLETFRT
jgi:MFS family permease